MLDLQATRKLLIQLLSDALLGDQLGAEFALLHLLSVVYVITTKNDVTRVILPMNSVPCAVTAEQRRLLWGSFL